MSISHSTTNNQLALTESHWGRLVDQQASPLLKRIIGKIPAPDAFVVQLVCELCMCSSRSALLRVVGQNHRGRGHQWLRFEWVRGWSDSRGLVYQRQPRWLLVWNMDTCRLLALVGWMCLSICEVLKWARVNGCDWTRRYG